VACAVSRWVSDLTSRAFGLGLSDLFGVGLVFRTAVPCLSACLFGVQAAVQSDRIIVRSRMRPQAGTSSTSNYCSPPHQLGVDEMSDSDSQLFGILAPAPGQRVLTYAFARLAWCFSNYCSLSTSWTPGTTNKKTHANAWAFLRVFFFLTSPLC
jgi:hypothetical protein